MKSFVISIILLVVVIIFVFSNSVYGGKVYGDMADALETALLSPADNHVDEAQASFARNKSYIFFTLNETVANTLFADLYEGVAYYRAGDIASFEAVFTKVIFQVRNLKKSEQSFLFG